MIFKQAAIHAALALCFVAPSPMATAEHLRRKLKRAVPPTSDSQLRLVQYSDSECNSKNGVSNVVESFASYNTGFVSSYRDDNDNLFVRRYGHCGKAIGDDFRLSLFWIEKKCARNDGIAECGEIFLIEPPCGPDYEMDECRKYNRQWNTMMYRATNGSITFLDPEFTTDSCVQKGNVYFRIEGPEDEIKEYWDTIFDNTSCLSAFDVEMQRAWKDNA